ncbi:MAG: AzlC family ABC transporter permease [Cohaesibacteraceae bacterium]|nr:AzlC family ABC transporter permease [Cohaesibacteraceae bacterium]MBL4876946.1 AzlC family ABC transporter permease [Cohaesibacteraceae bacterium]
MQSKTRISIAGILEGIRKTAPLSFFVIPFGFGYGTTAGQIGLVNEFALLNSVTTFAGASQFIALDFLRSAPVAFAPLMLAVFAVNARHILFGAALYPWLKDLSWWKILFASLTLSDVNFAFALQEKESGRKDVGLLVGSGMMLWTIWALSTWGGLVFGSLIDDPQAYGLDAVMLTFFACLIVGMYKPHVSALPWITSAIVALVAVVWLPENWHILAGALAGGFVSIFQKLEGQT